MELTPGLVSGSGCLARIHTLYPSLQKAEQKIARFVMDFPEQVIRLTVAQFAQECSVAQSTIVRFTQSVGYKGYSEFKISLAQDIVPTIQYIHQNILPTDSETQITHKVFQAAIHGLSDTLKGMDHTEMSKAIEAICTARKVDFYGVGASLPIADEAYTRFIRINVLCSSSGDPYNQVASAALLKPGDVAFGISYSGNSAPVVKALSIAKSSGATTICLTNYVKSPITKVSDIKLITSFREISYRLEAMAARIAQLAIVEALYANVAVRKGDQALAYIEKIRQILE